MKTLRYLIFALLTGSAMAQTVIGTEFGNTLDFPAGTFTLQYGCANNWTTKTFTYSKATAGVSFTYLNFGLPSDPKACTGQPQIEILPNATSFSIGIHSWTGAAYGAAVQKTIAASPPTPAPTPAPTPPTTVAIGATGSCTWSLTVDASGNPLLTIK